MKTCEAFAENLALFYDGTLTKEQQEELMQHVEECSSCARLLETYRVLLHEMEDFAVEPPESMHAKIMEASKQVPVKRKIFDLPRAFTTMAAAAAVVFLIINGTFGDLSKFYLSDNKTAANSTADSGQNATMAPAFDAKTDINLKSKESALAIDEKTNSSEDTTAVTKQESPKNKKAGSNSDQGNTPIDSSSTKLEKKSTGSSAHGQNKETTGSSEPEKKSEIANSSTSTQQNESTDTGALQQDNAGSQNESKIMYQITSPEDKAECPKTVPLSGSFALVIVAKGTDLTGIQIMAPNREAEDENAFYYAVNNDETLLTNIKDTLKAKGFEVTSFYNGAEYIEPSSAEALVVIEKK
ncbi:MAG: zf-HC2 domain-containing protein [Clostridiales bacterium]|nr:zf-HC2 domain-containing protein [Clostridiales bacterium]